MRHHNSTRTLGRKRNQRKALLRSLARSLVLRGKIRTTEAKAKELRPYVEKLITRGKEDTLANRRTIGREFSNQPEFMEKLFKEVSPRYRERAGGYTRITKLSSYHDDGRKTAQIELV